MTDKNEADEFRQMDSIVREPGKADYANDSGVRETEPDDCYWDDDEDDYCYTCDGKGYIITCIDDLCHGGDYCIHGDGETICPECHGKWL